MAPPHCLAVRGREPNPLFLTACRDRASSVNWKCVSRSLPGLARPGAQRPLTTALPRRTIAGRSESNHAEDSSVVDAFFSWNGEWSPQGQCCGWEGVREAFRDCKMPPTTFGSDFPTLLQQGVDASLLSGDVLSEWKRPGLP